MLVLPLRLRRLFLGLVLLLGFSASAAADAVPRILLVHSYHDTLDWTADINRGFLQAFSETGQRVEIYVEYLDAIRFPNRSSAEFMSYLVAKYGSNPPDLLVVADDQAFDLLKVERNRIAPGKPLIFCGLNDLTKEQVAGLQNLVGVAEIPSFKETLQLMRRLRPLSRTLVVVGDKSHTYQINKAGLQRALQSLDDPFPNVRYVEDSQISPVTETLARLSSDSVIFLMARLADADGIIVPAAEAGRRLTQAAPVPTFSTWNFWLGQGLVGGKVISGFQQGYTAGLQAKRGLGGAPVQLEDSAWESPNKWQFDYAALSRFGLSLDALPSDSEIINRPPGIWEAHREFMLLLIFIGAVLLTLILAQGAILRVRSRTMKTVSNRESELIVRLSRAAEFRDPETGFHISRMGYFSKLIAMQLGLSEKMCGLIQRAACMHDVGKIGTPDSILLKAGPLDTKELAVMRRHPEIGHSILDGSESALIKLAAEIAITHHEKFDGTGYPSGLSGEEIPLVGRIVAVADVFDALTSTRPYKVAWDIERARSYLLENQGSHFDPRCVEAFMSAWPQVKAVREQYPDQESRSA